MRSFILTAFFIASLAVVCSTVQAGTIKPALDRQSPCGPGLPSCSRNRCCNRNNKCGFGKRHCKADSCQRAFGRCWTKQQTSPVDPDDVQEDARPERPQNGAPASVIYRCTVPGTVAVTFDDGPAATTPALLDRLASERDVKVTFFVNGNNYVDASQSQHQATMRRIVDAGHQIASHTFQHKDLTSLSVSEIRDQMLMNDDVIYSATGKVPRYARPPFGSVDDEALGELGRLGYVVVNWDVDTRDWDNKNAQDSMVAYSTALRQDKTMFIALQHDTVYSSTNNLMDLVIPALRARGLRMVTVAECLGDSRPYL